MIIAAAQTNPRREDIEWNLQDHRHKVELAARHGADLILFPELSLTGYERDKAMQMAFTENDKRLNGLRTLSTEKKIAIIAGAPILLKHHLYIGAFIINPDKSLFIYTKQFLHTGEEKFYKSSLDYNPILKLKKERISIAICADIDHYEHPKNASRNETSLYLASIFFSPGGIAKAHNNLSDYAKEFSMDILMSNYVGQPWGMKSGGQSGCWNKKGELVASLNATDTGVLLVEKINNTFKKRFIISD